MGIYPAVAPGIVLVSNFVSYAKGQLVVGFLRPIGMVSGFNFTLGYTADVRESNVNFYTIIADYRRYFRTGLRTAYALRITSQINQGKEALPFFLGGSWDLRLYPRARIWGEKNSSVE